MAPHPLARRTREPRPLVQAGQIGPAPLAGAIKTLGPGRQIVSQDSPDGVSRIGGQAGTQAPDPTPVPVKTGEAGPEAPIHILPADYLHLSEGGRRRRPIKHRSARSGRPRRYPLLAESCGTAGVSAVAIMGRDRPATGSRRGTCGLSWPGRADVTGTGDGGHGRESRFAAMLDL